MKHHDQQEIQRVDARNSLEKYIIGTLESIPSIRQMTSQINQKCVQQFINYLEQIEKWIGTSLNNCSREHYDYLRNTLDEFKIMHIIKQNYDNFELHLHILTESFCERIESLNQ